MKNLEITFALIKPHILKNVCALKRVQDEIKENFIIVRKKEVLIDEKLGSRFYEEHNRKFFYNRLLSFMCSGPSLAFILASENGIQKWRKLMGPTKVFRAVHEDPHSLRAYYGLSDTRNVCHGSDSFESVRREIEIFFPDFNPERWLRKKQD